MYQENKKHHVPSLQIMFFFVLFATLASAQIVKRQDTTAAPAPSEDGLVVADPNTLVGPDGNVLTDADFTVITTTTLDKTGGKTTKRPTEEEVIGGKGSTDTKNTSTKSDKQILVEYITKTYTKDQQTELIKKLKAATPEQRQAVLQKLLARAKAAQGQTKKGQSKQDQSA